MKYFFISVLILALSCDDAENTPELIDKLRAIGVEADQGSYTYSTAEAAVTATLTFYLASNDTSDLVVQELSLDDEEQLSLSEPVVTFDDKTDFRIYFITVTAQIPTEDLLEFDDNGEAVIAYALGVSQGSEEERIKGRVKVYQPGVSVAKPSIAITSPLDGGEAGGGLVNLTAELSAEYDENYRISWFVSSGVILKRRAIETEWEDMASGTRTILVTARGLSSGNFTYNIIEANIL